MIDPLQLPTEREDVFVERYTRLLGWSLHLTENDRGLAEDLLHDLFIQFTVNEIDLHKISNLDGYLYTMLRNLHLAQRRRDSRNRLQQFSIVEYDSAEIGLRTTDARDQIQAQDELRRVCQYACGRKDTAKAASVLILRFFHGYYPEEIVRILRGPRSLADQLLRLARNEAKATLADGGQLAYLNQTPVPEVLPTGYARGLDDFLEELRQTIFQARSGNCLAQQELKNCYSAESATPIQGSQLSHLVSCPECLDRVNTLLGLPMLSERSATEMLGRDTRKRGGGGPGGTGASGGGLTRQALNKLRRRVKDTLVHKPRELCVSVNGYALGSQLVGSERSELNLIVDQDEHVSFVEVFSEQKIRLLMMAIDALPPDGPGEQVTHVRLSDQRTLELRLRFLSPSPTIQVVYVDPHFSEPLEPVALDDDEPLSVLENATAITVASDESRSDLPAAADLPALRDYSRPRPSIRSLVALTAAKVARAVKGVAGSNFWSKPAFVTAVFAVMMLVATVMVYRHRPASALVAANLLKQSADSEEAIATNRNQVVHRTINVEERRVAQTSNGTQTSGCDGCGELIARRKIEIWQSAEKGISARRLYDEKNQLIAGDWRRADGVQTLYHHGARPKLQLNPEKGGIAALNFENVWQFSPSAKEFSSLISNTSARVEERSDTYIISAEPLKSADGYTPSGSPSVSSVVSSDLVRATLVLKRADLHAIEQTIVLRQRTETREYRFTETSFEQKSPPTVAPSVFEPEPELLSAAKLETPNSILETASPAVPLTTVTATPELEVEVLQRLNQAGALLGEQVSLTRTREGLLRVQGIVETDQRKREIINALGSVANDPAVRVELQTVNEAVARQKPSTSGGVTVQQLESSKSTITVDSELRKYFSSNKGLSGDQLEQQIRVFSDRMMSHSRQARRHALALKQITERFSAEELRSLDPAARAQWRTLVSEHARAFQQELSALRRELQPVFAAGGASEERSDLEIASEADFARAARRLFDLAAGNDDAVRTAFSISDENASVVRIKSPQFWRSLATAESLAARIGAVARP